MNGGLLHALNAPARRPLLAAAIAAAVALLALASTSRLRPDPSPLKSLFPPGQPAAAALNRCAGGLPDGRGVARAGVGAGRQRRRRAAARPPARLRGSLRARGGGRPGGQALVTGSQLPRRPPDDGLHPEGGRPQRAVLPQRRRVRRGPPPADPAGDGGAAPPGRGDARHAGAGGVRPGQGAPPGPAAAATSSSRRKLAEARPVKTYQNSDAILSEDGRSLLIRVTGAQTAGDLTFCDRITTAVAALADRVNTDHLTVELSGAYPIAAQSQRSIRRDSISGTYRLGPLPGAAVPADVPPLAAAVRGRLPPVALGILCGFGAYALFSRSVTPLTAVIGAVLAGVGIDYAIFYLVHYQERRVPRARAAWRPPADTLGTIGGALVAAWVTSVTGFVAVSLHQRPGAAGFRGRRVAGVGRGAALCGVPAAGDAGVAGPTAGAAGTAAGRGRRPSRARRPPRARRPVLDAPAAAVDRPAGRRVPGRVAGGDGRPPRRTWRVAGPWLELEPDPTVLHPRPNPPLDAEAHIARRMGLSPDSLIVHLTRRRPGATVALAHRVDERLTGPAGAGGRRGVTTFGLATLLPDPAVASRRMTQVGPALADRVVADFDAAVAQSSFDPKAYDGYRAFLRILLTPTRVPGVADLAPYASLAGYLPAARALAGAGRDEAITLVFLNRPMDAQADREALVGSIRGLLARPPRRDADRHVGAEPRHPGDDPPRPAEADGRGGGDLRRVPADPLPLACRRRCWRCCRRCAA